MKVSPDLTSDSYGAVTDRCLRVPGPRDAVSVHVSRSLHGRPRFPVVLPYLSALAGYRALRLLLQEAPDFVWSLQSEIWKRWAPVILAYPTSSASDDEEVQVSLVEWAYSYAPSEISKTLMLLIDGENKQRGRIFITRKLASCWDTPLALDVLAKARDTALTPESMGDLLEELVKHKIVGATAFAASLTSLPLPSEGAERERALVAARVLLLHAEDAGWTTIWPAVQHDTAFGRELIEGVVFRARLSTGNLGQQLTRVYSE